MSLPNSTQVGESVRKHSFNTHVSYRNEANTKCCSSWDAPGMDGDSQRSEMVFDNQTAEKNEVEVGLMKTNSGSSFAAVVRGVHNPPQNKWSSLFNDSTTSDAWKENKDITTTSDACKEIKDITALDQKLNLSISDQSETEWDCNYFGPCLDEQGSHPSKAPTDEDGKEMIHKEDIQFKSNGECTSFSVMPKENISEDNDWDDWEDRVNRIMLDSIDSPKAAIALEMESPAVQSIVAKVIKPVHYLLALAFEFFRPSNLVSFLCRVIKVGEGSQRAEVISFKTNSKNQFIGVRSGMFLPQNVFIHLYALSSILYCYLP